MAISGVLIAMATVNGVPEIEASVTITVTPRNWSTKTGSHEMQIDSLGNGEGEEALPAMPDSFPDFGKFQGRVFPAGDPFEVTQVIPDGPNAGARFLTDVPAFSVRGRVWINYTALNPGSDFLALQTGGSYCTAQQVAGILPQVEAHEGLGIEENSHARWFLDKANETPGIHFEGVAGDEETFIVRLGAATQAWVNEASVHAFSLHNHAFGKAPVPDCNINFPVS